MSAKPLKRIYVEITNRCNWSCSFCPTPERKSPEMALEVFKEIADLSKPLCEEITLHVLGEPMSHKNFRGIIDYCKEIELPIFLVTNGTYIKRYQTALLSNPLLKQINFSLHGLPENPRSEKEHLFEVFSFLDQALSERPDLYINLRLWNHGKESEKFNNKILSKVNEHYGVTLNPNVDVGFNKSKKVVGRIYIHMDSPFQWPTLSDPIIREKISCYGLKWQIGILSDGSVVPCCLDHKGINNLGHFEEALPHLNEFMAKSESMLDSSELCRRCAFSKERCPS